MKKKERISLVIEGGGFKSVFSAGVLDAFIINRFNPFDIYIGVASGAMCLSYYIASQYKIYFSLSKEVCVKEEFLLKLNHNRQIIWSSEGLGQDRYVNLLGFVITKYGLKNLNILSIFLFPCGKNIAFFRCW